MLGGGGRGGGSPISPAPLLEHLLVLIVVLTVLKEQKIVLFLSFKTIQSKKTNYLLYLAAGDAQELHVNSSTLYLIACQAL